MARQITPAQLARVAARLRDHGEVSKERVTFADLFPDAFIQKHTDFNSRGEFVTAGRAFCGIEGTPADFGRDFLETEQFSEFVARHSRFGGWRDFAAQAQKERVVGKLLD